MTLFRQVAALISLVFVLVLAVVVSNNVTHFSRSLHGQMQTVAQDLATLLGIALASSGQGTDPAAVETFFNAAFDSGYLSDLELSSPAGELIHTKKQDLSIRGVPNWFIRLVPFEAPVGQSRVMENWTQIGTLRLTMHPGYAYAGMYESLKSVLLGFILITGAGFGVLWCALHLLLRPLRQVQAQADAIHENRFIRQPDLPSTRELRSVVQAMNRMVEKVQAVFVEQGDALNRYHELLYRDGLTGLGNRRQLLAKLDEYRAEEAVRGGHLALVYVHGLDELAEQGGYERADELRVELARTIEGALEGREYAAHISKHEFAVHLERDDEQATDCIRQLFETFKDSEHEDSVWLCAGLITLDPALDTTAALSEADFALTRAKAAGAQTIFHEARSPAELPTGRMQWRSFLQQCISDQRLFLAAQPVLRSDGVLDHREVFVRLRDDQGRVVPAGLFMPMASSLGLDHVIDLEVYRMALGLSDTSLDKPLAVNLSATFFEDAGAMATLEQLLESQDFSNRPRPYLEARHFLLHQHPQSAEMVCSRLREHGYRIGIDNLDLSLSLELLQAIRPAYVKVNARMLSDLAAYPGSAGLRALTTLTAGMDIRLMALGVETEALKDAMLELGVDALQGNFMAQVQELA